MGRPGKAIAITRPDAQSLPLRHGLESRGFDVVACPAIEIVPSGAWQALDTAIENLTAYDWLLFTSANAVDLFFQRLTDRGADCTVPIVVVGPGTAERVRHWHQTPALQPAAEFRAEGVVNLFPRDMSGKRVLFPRAETARELLPEQLRRRGAMVEMIPIYSTRKSESGLELLRTRLKARDIACVVFTSPSAVQFVAETLGEELEPLFDTVSVAVLGPIVREAAERAGLNVSIEPARALIPDLIDSISKHLTSNRSAP